MAASNSVPKSTAPGIPPNYVLRLYVSGATPRSAAAIQNVKQLCATHLRGRYDLQVIDVYQEPALASEAAIIAVPTLVKQFPLPLRQLVGDLSQQERVLVALDLLPRPVAD